MLPNGAMQRQRASKDRGREEAHLVPAGVQRDRAPIRRSISIVQWYQCVFLVFSTLPGIRLYSPEVHVSGSLHTLSWFVFHLSSNLNRIFSLLWLKMKEAW